MQKHFHGVLIGISVLPALLIMPAMADVLGSINSAMEIAVDETYDVGAINFTGLDRGETPQTYGVIDNNGTLNFTGTTISNNTGKYGVIDNMGTTTVTNAVANGNTALTAGGFVFNEDKLTIKNSTFTSNKAEDWGGGAVYNYDNLVKIFDSKFNNNVASAGDGGAIANGAFMEITNTSFVGNKAQGVGNQSGAVMNYLFYKEGGQTVDDVVLTIKNSTFTGNSAPDVGAVTNLSTANIIGSTFSKNHADLDAEHEGDGAGALFVGSESITLVKDTDFSENTSGTVGGAIATRSTGKEIDGLSSGNNSAAKLDIIGGSTFSKNVAGTKGGAFYNGFHDSAAHEGYVTLTDVTFSENRAVDGGAIYNTKPGTTDSVGGKIYGTNLNFANNVASNKGGAVYNNVDFVLAGTNTFTGNKANGVANDIFNSGTVTVASGTTTLDGGIDGNGTLTVANGATLNIGTASIEQGTITLNGDMLATLRDGDAQIAAGTFDGDGTLKLSLRGADTYHVFGNQKFANYEIESSVYDYEWTNDGKDIVSTMKSVADIASENGLTGETANAIAGMSGSTSEKLNELSLQIQDKLASGSDADKADVEHATRAIHPETESVVQSMASAVQNTVTSLAAGRMALPKLGRNGGDVNFTSGGVWAQGIYNKTKQNDAFNGYTRGIAAGIDGTINKVWTIGAGYAFAHSDIAGTARDTEIDSNTIFVYGQYKPTEWYLNATASYTMSDYSENGIALGTPVTADYDVDAYGAKIATGYDFAGGITPEFAARYMHIDSTDYINSFDTKNQLNDADYLTLSLTTKYARNFRTTKGLTLRPELHWGVLYDVLSDEQVATVTMPGVDSYTLNGARLSRIGGDFGAGLSMNYKNFDLSVNYNIEVREDYTSQTGMVRARINF